jgi:hypothetical protein
MNHRVRIDFLERICALELLDNDVVGLKRQSVLLGKYATIVFGWKSA